MSIQPLKLMPCDKPSFVELPDLPCVSCEVGCGHILYLVAEHPPAEIPGLDYALEAKELKVVIAVVNPETSSYKRYEP